MKTLSLVLHLSFIMWAAKNLQSVWKLYDHEAAERWMNTLPAATQTKVRNLVKSKKE